MFYTIFWEEWRTYVLELDSTLPMSRFNSISIAGLIFYNNTLYLVVIIIGDMDHVLHSFKIFCKNNPQNYYMYIFIRLTYRTTPLPMF